MPPAEVLASRFEQPVALKVPLSQFLLMPAHSLFFVSDSLCTTGLFFCLPYLRREEIEPTEKKRKVLTLEEKAEIIHAVSSGHKKCSVAAQHGLSASQPARFLQS